jgi:streptogramin lyase
MRQRLPALSIVLLLCLFRVQGQVISTVAGTGTAGRSGDGGLGKYATLNGPFGVVADPSSHVYIADRLNNIVRRITDDGRIVTWAGTGAAGYSGDGGAATAAMLNNVTGLACDGNGMLYIADKSNHRVRMVTEDGRIVTIAGTGAAGYGGDGGPATAAMLANPFGVAVDQAGNVYIADQGNDRVRKIDAHGIISTVAGNGTAGYGGDGGPATSAMLHGAYGVAVDYAGDLYIADVDNERIRKVDKAGIISTFAGMGTGGYSGDGGPATAAELYEPIGVATDYTGIVYIADAWNSRIRKVDRDGTITTVAGVGIAGDGGDGGLADRASLRLPYGIAAGSFGDLWVGDYGNNKVRHISSLREPRAYYTVSVYPSPAHGEFIMNVAGNVAGPVDVVIRDMSGSKVKEFTANTNRFIDVYMMGPPGIYDIFVSGNGISSYARLVMY